MTEENAAMRLFPGAFDCQKGWSHGHVQGKQATLATAAEAGRRQKPRSLGSRQE